MIKTIKTTIILGDGEFSDGTNTRIIEGLATKVDVQKAGLPEKNTAHIQIANLSLAEMEQLLKPGKKDKDYLQYSKVI